MPTHEPDREQRDDERPFSKPITTRAGVSDGDATNGEFLSDMEYDEGDRFYEELGAVMQGKDIEDTHTPDMTTDPENRRP